MHPTEPAGCELAESRIRELLSQLTFQNFKAVSAQIVAWANAGLHLVQSADQLVDIIYTAATVHDTESELPEVLARVCRELTKHMKPSDNKDINGKGFLELLLGKCSHEFGEAKRILDNHGREWMYEMGSWPQFISLLRFAGELFKAGLLSEDVLLHVFVDPLTHDSQLTDLKVEGLCILTKTVGYLLDEEGVGRREVQSWFQLMHKYATNHSIPPALSDMLKDLYLLRANGWIPLLNQASRAQGPAESSPPSPSSSAKPPPYNFERTYPDIGSNSNNTNTDAAPGNEKSTQEYDLPQHDEFYLHDGNVIIVCDSTLFRVHTGLLSINSSEFKERFSPRSLEKADRLRGCPLVHLEETEYDLYTLLKVIYYPGFPARHKIPNFPVFSAILRMTTKYKIHEIREQILVDLQEAYPKTFEVYEASTVLGQSVFGEPKPHPNTVLNLFKQCNVNFSLPYAFYMACRGGLSSLTRISRNATLPPPTLAAAVRGLGRLNAAELTAAKNILFQRQPHKCDRFSCHSASKIYHEKGRQQIFRNVFDCIIDSSNDMVTRALETPQFDSTSETIFCKTCLEIWLTCHREARAKIWNSLGEFFELYSREGSNMG